MEENYLLEKSPFWPLMLILIGVLLFWIDLLFGDNGLGAFIIGIFLLILITISMILSLVVYTKKKKKGDSSFRNRFFFYLSILFATSPLHIYFIFGIGRKFIGTILSPLSFSNEFIYGNFILIFMVVLLSIILTFISYALAKLSEEEGKEKGKIILFSIFFILLLPILFNLATQVMYNCDSDSQCLLNRALEKENILECKYFLVEESSVHEMNCIRDFARIQHASSEECELLEEDYMVDYCLINSASSSKNFSLCKYSKYPSDCFTELAFRARDFSICTEIEDPSGLESCYYRMAWGLNLKELCEKVGIYKTKKSCLSKID